MSDRSWALNSSFLIVARNCIKLIEGEFGVKLMLADEAFLQKIGHYAQQTRSARTLMSCTKLASFDGVEISGLEGIEIKAKVEQAKSTDNVTTLKPKQAPAINMTDRIQYNGREYSRFNESGQEFRGLYRGAARYA